MAASPSRAGRITDRRAQAKRRRRRALWCVPVLLALVAAAIHLHMDGISADLAGRSRAALRAAEFSTVEVAFSGREAMVRGHVADGLHMAAVETIIESQRGVRWADLNAVTVGGPTTARAQPAMPKTSALASAAPMSAALVSAAPVTAAAPLSVAAVTEAPTIAVPSASPTSLAVDDPRDAGLPPADGGSTPDASTSKSALIALSWTDDGPALDGTLPSEATQAAIVKTVTTLLHDADWEDRSVVQDAVEPLWLPALMDVLPQLVSVERLTLRIDAHAITIGGAVMDAAARARAEELLEAACPQHVLTNQLAVMKPPKQIAVRMHAMRGLDLFFGPDGVNLTEDGAAELTQIAAILKGATGAVRIESHTDNVGKVDTNQARSDARAAVVRDFLQGQGVPTGRLHAVGRGARNPIADNSTEDGRALNRRIVITLDP